jgi:predicted GNAT family acetyltransferase
VIVATVTDPAEFLERAAGLLEDEARHNLMRGVVRTLVRSPEVFPDYRLYLVERDGAPVAAASITAPFNLVLADTDDETAVAELVSVAAEDPGIPGVFGNRPTVTRFVDAWETITGRVATLQMEQGVFRLDAVHTVERPPGAFRPAAAEDLGLLVEWMLGFMAEALPHETTDLEGRAHRWAERHIAGGEAAGAMLWDLDGTVVSLSGHGHPTGSGIRIGPVYTPPEHRGNGYATALVADQSQWLLDNGFDACFLFTDLANPTSNRIYERIGYRQVAEAASYGFDEAG